MKAYKGFNKNFKCKNFQYKIGKTYETKKCIKLCEIGFHCCKNPINVFSYYNDPQGKYAEVKILGKTKEIGDKTVTSKIKIVKEISFWDIFKMNMQIVIDLCVKSAKKSTAGWRSHANTAGYGSHANTAGYGSHANTAGDRSHANTAGYGSYANTAGENSIASGLGYKNKAKAIKGWIVLAEYDNNYNIIHIKSGKVGKQIKSNIWYKLENNKFVKCEE